MPGAPHAAQQAHPAAARVWQAARKGLACAWASPVSLLGLAVLLLGLPCGVRARVAQGALEVALCARSSRRRRAWLHRLPFAAITLGHVIVGLDARTLATLRAHEQGHVRQYEAWGALFLLAYPAASLWQLLQGRHPYWHNPFEVQARAQEAPLLSRPVPPRSARPGP